MKKTIFLLAFMVLVISCQTTQKNNVNEEILWINSSEVSCEGAGPMLCLEVQRGETFNASKWQLFYSGIEGFIFESGNIYKLKVKKEKLNPDEIPADGSSVKYTLIEVLSKKQDATLRLQDIWVATSLNGKELTFKDEKNRPRLEFQIAERKINGKGTCNTFFGDIKNVSETQLEINDKIGTTMMACPEMDTETAFFETLPKVKTYKIADNELQFFDADNNKVLQFKKID